MRSEAAVKAALKRAEAEPSIVALTAARMPRSGECLMCKSELRSARADSRLVWKCLFENVVFHVELIDEVSEARAQEWQSGTTETLLWEYSRWCRG